MHRQQLRQITLTEASFTSAEKIKRCCAQKCIRNEEMSWHLEFLNHNCNIVLTFNELKKKKRLSMTFSFIFDR